jgi:hypothetical protein
MCKSVIAALELSGGSTATDDRLATALQSYAVAQDKVGQLRLEQDKAISEDFVQPWSTTVNSQIQAANRSRQNVKSAR